MIYIHIIFARVSGVIATLAGWAFSIFTNRNISRNFVSFTMAIIKDYVTLGFNALKLFEIFVIASSTGNRSMELAP